VLNSHLLSDTTVGAIGSGGGGASSSGPSSDSGGGGYSWRGGKKKYKGGGVIGYYLSTDTNRFTLKPINDRATFNNIKDEYNKAIEVNIQRKKLEEEMIRNRVSIAPKKKRFFSLPSFHSLFGKKTSPPVAPKERTFDRALGRTFGGSVKKQKHTFTKKKKQMRTKTWKIYHARKTRRC
jgi:hypothetical protein